MLLGLIGAGLVFMGISLASGREINVRYGEFGALRLWMVHEELNTGLGVSTSKPVGKPSAEERTCVETSVRFLLWRSDGSSRNVGYCECYQRLGGVWQLAGTCGS